VAQPGDLGASAHGADRSGRQSGDASELKSSSRSEHSDTFCSSATTFVDSL
jgi:hypothetical protein